MTLDELYRMTSLGFVILILAFLAVSVVAIVQAARARKLVNQVASLSPSNRPCYRCGTRAEVDYMGLYYCEMCRRVVVAVMPAVRHDPPYGFPGSEGYLEFPKEKKESHA